MIYIYEYHIYIYIHICISYIYINNYMIYPCMNHFVCFPQNLTVFLRASPGASPRWCAGVMLFELLSGNPPFASRLLVLGERVRESPSEKKVPMVIE